MRSGTTLDIYTYENAILLRETFVFPGDFKRALDAVTRETMQEPTDECLLRMSHYVWLMRHYERLQEQKLDDVWRPDPTGLAYLRRIASLTEELVRTPEENKKIETHEHTSAIDGAASNKRARMDTEGLT